MAVTGVIMFGFLVTHCAGNLQVFEGAEKMDDYAVLLRKFEAALLGHLAGSQVTSILNACRDPRTLESMPLHKFMSFFTA